MHITQQKHPTSFVDLISVNLFWAFICIPVILVVAGGLDLYREAGIALTPILPGQTVHIAATPEPNVLSVKTIGALGSQPYGEVQYFQDRAAQLREAPSEYGRWLMSSRRCEAAVVVFGNTLYRYGLAGMPRTGFDGTRAPTEITMINKAEC